jgi:hypothetical protein
VPWQHRWSEVPLQREMISFGFPFKGPARRH